MDREVPSTIDYKDQGRDLRDIVGTGTTSSSQSATIAVTGVPSAGYLHSHLEYKDQGRDPHEVLFRARAAPQQIGELPSDVEYKDQGRDLQDVLARARARPQQPAQADDDGAILVSASPVQSTTPRDSAVSLTNHGDEHVLLAFQCRKTTLYVCAGIVIGLVLLGIVVVAVMMLVVGDDGDDDDTRDVPIRDVSFVTSSAPTLAPTPFPTLSPTTNTTTALPTQGPTSVPTSLPTAPLCSYCPLTPNTPLPNCSTRPVRANCTDILSSGARFGRRVQGVDLRCYTGGVLEWIGCRGGDSFNCSPDTFFCSDDDPDRLEFGTTSTRYMAALFDPEDCCPRDSDPGRILNFCASSSSPTAIINPPTTDASATALCQSLGYGYGDVASGNAVGCLVAQHGGGGPSDWAFAGGRPPSARLYICTTYPPTQSPTPAPSPAPSFAPSLSQVPSLTHSSIPSQNITTATEILLGN